MIKYGKIFFFIMLKYEEKIKTIFNVIKYFSSLICFCFVFFLNEEKIKHFCNGNIMGLVCVYKIYI